jgi:lactate permease
VAVLAFDMPAGLAVLAATEGAVFALFPILAIVLMALWIYQLTVVSGRFEDLRSAFGYLSTDPRVQAIIVAFCFGALLEALAGFGAPVAITAVMLLAIGFTPVRAAGIVLVANTAPVAFGAIGIPIITAGNLTDIPYEEIGAYVGRQTPILALVVPLVLVWLADGRQGVRETWPVAVVAGSAFALAQFVSSNYISVELTTSSPPWSRCSPSSGCCASGSRSAVPRRQAGSSRRARTKVAHRRRDAEAPGGAGTGAGLDPAPAAEPRSPSQRRLAAVSASSRLRRPSSASAAVGS